MKQSLSYEKCYKLLNINIDCSSEELRKAYRTLVHKWHPDRVEDEEKAIATDKLKNLNAAYKQLTNYYSKHGVLPLFPPRYKLQNRHLQSRKKIIVVLKLKKYPPVPNK